MKGLLKPRRLLNLCLAGGLVLFLVFPTPALAQVTVSDPQILDATDFATPGAWQENGFGKCFYLLPGPVVPGDNEPVGPDFFSMSPEQYTSNTCFGAGDPTIDFIFPDNIDWRIFRGDPDDEALAFTAAPTPADDIQEKAKQNPGCVAGGLLNRPKGTTWDDGDSFSGVLIKPPMASELNLNYNGSLSLAFYFVNGEAPTITLNGATKKLEECRTQDFILSVFPSVGDPVTRTGTIAEFSMGKYLVFELDGLEGETLLRFETTPSSIDLCTSMLGTKCTTQNFPDCDFAPAENDVLSGVFIDDCEVTDEDGDGIPDDQDECPDTVIPESVPTKKLGTNRFALIDGDTTFDTKAPKGKGPQKAFTIDDTAGCSCEQIIEELGLGKGHAKFGCSISAMEEWIDSHDFQSVSCDNIKPITKLSLIWDGQSGINVTTELGQEINGINAGDVIVLDTEGAGNDLDITISGAISGGSMFHFSCSDDDMNGPEDCFKFQGDGKGEPDWINDWLFAGMEGKNGIIDCNP
jgi:hypothetical protein